MALLTEAANRKTKTGDRSEIKRLKFMEKYTTVGNSDLESDEMCGPTFLHACHKGTPRCDCNLQST